MFLLFRHIRHYGSGLARFAELDKILATCKISVQQKTYIFITSIVGSTNKCVLRAKNNGVQGTRV